HACRVGGAAGIVADVEQLAEMILMPVRRRDRGRALGRGDGYDELELQRLLSLRRGEESTTPAEEWVVRRDASDVEADLTQDALTAREPFIAKGDAGGRVSQPDD